MSLARLLKHTRTRLKVSQLDLALRLGVSQRHVSYLELGRARPSKQLLLAWMRELDAPASIRNAALVQGGFATADGHLPEAASALAAVRAAMRQVLDAHEPFPAVVFNIDRYVTDCNRSGRWMWSVLMPRYWADVQARGVEMDMIESLAHEDGFLSRMREPLAAATSFLGLLRREVWLRPSLEPRVAAFADYLQRRFGPVDTEPGAEPGNPQCEFVFETQYGALSFILVQSIVGLPQDINVDTPRLELWFPADAATRARVQANAPAAA